MNTQRTLLGHMSLDPCKNALQPLNRLLESIFFYSGTKPSHGKLKRQNTYTQTKTKKKKKRKKTKTLPYAICFELKLILLLLSPHGSNKKKKENTQPSFSTWLFLQGKRQTKRNTLAYRNLRINKP